jgi:phosphonate transport system substrate-binding protein
MKFLLSFTMFVLLTLTGCQQGETVQGSQPHYADARPAQDQVFVFGIHPLYNPQRLNELFGPLADYLSKQVPQARFIIESSKDYADYNNKLRARQFDFALPNPYQTLLAIDSGYQVTAKVAPDDDFMGIILTPKTAKLSIISALKGATIAFPAPSALAATMLPQWLLFQHGLKPNIDYQVSYVVSQESSILSVANGTTQASATIPAAWRQFQHDYPERAEKLTVSWKTQTLPNIGFVVRNDVPESIKTQATNLLIDLEQNEAGKAILAKTKLGHFEVANQETYAPVAQFVTLFEQEVRKTEAP